MMIHKELFDLLSLPLFEVRKFISCLLDWFCENESAVAFSLRVVSGSELFFNCCFSYCSKVYSNVCIVLKSGLCGHICS